MQVLKKNVFWSIKIKKLVLGFAVSTKKIPATVTIVYFLSTSSFSFSQLRRVVAIGSSTTAGTGASVKDSCWVSLLNNYYKNGLGIVDSVYNLGVGNSDPYNGMPTSSVPPQGRPSPDHFRNVTTASGLLKNLTHSEDGVVIVNYPTNGYNTYSTSEVMSSLQTIYDSATATGNFCFISTTQPRCDGQFSSPVAKRKLAEIKDSIVNRFGTAHTINFWDGMFNPADSTILPMYAAGDGIHFNNAGHRELFRRVSQKNIFALPLWYSRPAKKLNTTSAWSCTPDGNGSCPPNFSADNAIYIITGDATIDSDWKLSGKRIKLIVGDGTKPANFTIPANFKVSLTSPPPGN